VQGLPNGCDDAQLKKLFAKFGEITSAHVQKGDSGDFLKNRGFVSFKEGSSA
jgi:RNA recognition motif-containing protein